jgi:succinylglutamate desuccinylase
LSLPCRLTQHRNGTTTYSHPVVTPVIVAPGNPRVLPLEVRVTTMLHELERLPPGLLEVGSTRLEAVLGGPTLIHLAGRREPPLFVSVLMHGNETVGWDAVRALLSGYREREIPRSISLFIGNVTAAAQAVRRLDGQPDYNRVWPSTEVTPETPEHRLMQAVVEIMEQRGAFASVDIHNNTGFNPHYACINVVDNRFLHLATLFSRTVVYFLRPRGVQSMAMAQLCPAVTLECGKVGQAHGMEHAREYLEACLHLAVHPEHSVAEHDIDLFHTVAQVKVPEDVSFSFRKADVDIHFADDIDRLNFRELPRGTSLGRIRTGGRVLVDVRDEQGRNVSERFFGVEDSELRVQLPVMPSMLTTDERVIRQDCLCYLMERYDPRLIS